MDRARARAALEALLRSAQASVLVADADMEEMIFDFYGLLWGMRQTWVLLGVDQVPSLKEIDRRAAHAASRFLKIYGPRRNKMSPMAAMHLRLLAG